MPINHTVCQGDSVISLSETHGLFAVTIWNDPGNTGLRQKRTDMNVLMPGEVVVIPDKRPRLEKRPTGQAHRFRRKGIHDIPLSDLTCTSRAPLHYTLTVDGVELKGTTDGSGILEQYIPAQAKKASSLSAI
jgi:N-acetylmuramoyl-L-alanine amidase